MANTKLYPQAYTLKNFAIFLVPAILLALASQLPEFLKFQECLKTTQSVCNGELNIRAALLYQMLVPVLGIFWLRYKKKYRWGDFGLGMPKVGMTTKYIGLGIVVIVVIQLLAMMIALFAPVFNEKQLLFADRGLLLQAWPIIILAIIGAPIVEELAFRGFTFSIIGRKFGAVSAAIISSATFGLVHGQVPVIFGTFLMGLYLCFMFTKTRSLIPGIVLHGLNNAIGILLLLIFG